MLSQLRITLLGVPKITYNNQEIDLERRKAVALVAYLALRSQRSGRDTLAALLWPELDDKRARANLRHTLTIINETPISDWLEVDRQIVALRDNADLWVDVVQFNTLMESAQVPDDLEAAIALYRDDFMTGFTLRDSVAFDDWQFLQSQALQQKLIAAIERLVQHYVDADMLDQAILCLERWLQIDPLNETAQRQYIRLYASTGQRAAALRQYETYVTLLEKELGVSPQRDLVQLYERIKSNEAIDLRERARPLYGNLPPMPALVIGRDDVVEALKARLADLARLIVQGWPGIGKTTTLAYLAHDEDIYQQFPDGVLWVSLGENPDLFSELVTWAHALGFESAGDLKTIEDVTNRVAALLRDKRMLLIIDDVWEAKHAMAFNVTGRHCKTIITTRITGVTEALSASRSDVYKIPILTEAYSLELLRTLAPDVVENNHTQALELVRDLEGLPLALQVAGRLLRAEMRMGWGIEELLRDLREGVSLLGAEVPADRVDMAHEPTPTVAVLLRRSTDRLNDGQREYFALLGVFAPKPATFDIHAMQAVWDVPDARPIARVLVERGLLEPLGNGRFQMHALLVMHAKSMFED